jgi:hypothetical protein
MNLLKNAAKTGENSKENTQITEISQEQLNK